jgi:LysM repeat protein
VVYESHEHPDPEAKGEWLKFAILLLISIGVIFVVMLSRSLVFERIVPAFLGDFLTTQPAEVDDVAPPPTNEDTVLEVQPPAGDDSVMTDEENAGINPTTTEPTTSEPTTVDPTVTDSAVTDPVVSDPAPEEPTVVEQNTTTDTNLTASPATAPNTQTHTVLAGHTLSAIAGRYGVTVESIMAANNMTDPNRINVGDVLIIPQNN